MDNNEYNITKENILKLEDMNILEKNKNEDKSIYFNAWHFGIPKGECTFDSKTSKVNLNYFG